MSRFEISDGVLTLGTVLCNAIHTCCVKCLSVTSPGNRKLLSFKDVDARLMLEQV